MNIWALETTERGAGASHSHRAQSRHVVLTASIWQTGNRAGGGLCSGDDNNETLIDRSVIAVTQRGWCQHFQLLPTLNPSNLSSDASKHLTLRTCKKNLWVNLNLNSYTGSDAFSSLPLLSHVNWRQKKSRQKVWRRNEDTERWTNGLRTTDPFFLGSKSSSGNKHKHFVLWRRN